jgi:hypothetical protein
MTWDARTGHPLELFDRAADPHQLDNRVEQARYREPMRDGWATVTREHALDP